jgi:hypothetical protein
MLLATAAWGLIPYSITFDENGNGSWNAGGASTPLLDNIDILGGAPDTLDYNLPFTTTMVQGDVKVLEPGTTAAVISDVLRFTYIDSDNSHRVYVYSDNSDGVDSLADNGIPTTFQSNVITVNEVGPEGSNGVTYTPTSGQPGYVSRGVTYYFTSDSVPEPATICLLGLGSLALFKRKRNGF